MSAERKVPVAGDCLKTGLAIAALAMLGGCELSPASLLRAWLPERVLGHAAAARLQQGQPTTAAEARTAIDRDLTIALARRDNGSANWGDQTAIGDLYLARARLSGSFDDYVAAGAAFEAAFASAPAGTGPHIERAGYNFAIHRLDAVAPDLAAIDRYAIPDEGLTAAADLLRGDVAFYRGRYTEARVLYERGRSRLPTLGGDVKLANFYARFGDFDRAEALLDEADGRITGPQQQLHAFVELRRGMLDLDRGRWPAAERHFRRADDIFPGYGPVEMQLATVRALRGAPDEALAIFLRVAARDQLPDAFDAAASIFRAKGDDANARLWSGKAGAYWEIRMRQLPEAAWGHALDHLLAFGDPARALDIAQRNFALRPYADAATGLAWAYLANHRPADALAAVAPTLASGWTSAEPHVVASEAYALMGQGKQSDEQRRAALAINPHSFDRNPGMTWLEQ